MAEKRRESGYAPGGARPAQTSAEASFLAMVRALRAIRSGTPAGPAAHLRRVPAVALEPAAPASRPWAF